MSDPVQFDVVFRGEIVEGQTVEKVKQKATQLFKLPPEKIDAMFTGQLVTLKKNIDQKTAEKYKTILQQSGMLVDVQEIKSQTEDGVKSVSDEQGDKKSQSQATQTYREIIIPDWVVDKPGVLLVEPQPPIENNISTSGITLSPPEGNLLKPEEVPPEPSPPPLPNLDELTLEEIVKSNEESENQSH